MRNRKVLISLIALSAAAVMFSIAWVNYGNTCGGRGYGDSWKGGCGKGGFLGNLCASLPSPCGLLCQKDDLGLSDDQVAKLKELKSSSKKDKIKKIADLKIKKIELLELLDEKSVDKNAVEAMLDDMGKMGVRIAKDCINTRLTTRELLTDEQLKKWESIKKPCQGDGPGAADGSKCDGKKKAMGSQTSKNDCGSSGWSDMRTLM